MPLTNKAMDDEEILQMVADGELDPSEVEDFQGLSDEIKELVANGEIDLDEAMELEWFFHSKASCIVIPNWYNWVVRNSLKDQFVPACRADTELVFFRYRQH